MPVVIMFLRFLSMAMKGRDLLSAQQGAYSSACAEQPVPRLRLFELHSLAGPLPVPRALYSTAVEGLRVSGVPVSDTTHTHTLKKEAAAPLQRRAHGQGAAEALERKHTGGVETAPTARHRRVRVHSLTPTVL
ncbi:hypothetical protein EYF80_034987 [Liparis tanakae]|uniref:Uncharacterized protein n=1 Tax=Liparis tanakae TaxID=230148 RepID=A0A4Z2GND6_9TELE|nr:hypothetical protein EYF80_034987 [Liparis tanakae]